MQQKSFFDEACDPDLFLHRPLDPAVAPETLAFETALCQRFSVREAVAVSSGTAALHCALAALGIGPGDEVLVPSLAVIMSVVPVLYQQAHPIFVDSAPGRVDFDEEDLERKVSPRTKAVIAVHLWGCSYDMHRVMQFARRHHLAVIEDACQAHGSQWQGKYLGTWGDVGCLSMRDGKLISTGEGGFLLTQTPAIAQACRTFRSHQANPRDPHQSYQRIGNNYRLSELQAWLGRKQVEHLDAILAHRRWQSTYLLDGLTDVAEGEPYRHAAEERSNRFSPLFLLDEALAKKGIARILAQRGVANSVGTFGLQPAQQWPVFSAHLSQPVATPHTGQLLSRMLALSLLPQYTAQDLDRIIATVKHTLMEAR